MSIGETNQTPYGGDDLIARLLAEETDLTDCAADRIERTEERNKELTLQLLAVHGQAADALDKLTKAVAALRKIADSTHIGDQGVTQHAEARISRATLAELEK